MMPSDPIETTLHKLGHVYLTETHVFGGNSGSPMFIDISRFKSGIGYDFHFLGVVAGEVFETNDLKLQVNTSFEGTVAANSGVAVVVPAEQLTQLMPSPSCKNSAMLAS